MKEYVLWGTKKGSEDWEEQVLLSRESDKDFEKVKELARKDGFDRFRVSIMDLEEKPDFTKALKRNPRK